LLKPEEGYFSDLGLRIWSGKFDFSANTFLNSLTNLIVEIPGTYIYNYSAEPENFDTLNALINSNVDKALLYGFDMAAGYNIFDGITLRAMTGFVRGRNTSSDSDLPQVPPLYGRLSVRYYLKGKLNAELGANLTADQEKVASGERTTHGYACYDFFIGSVPFQIRKLSLEGFGGVQNITDRAYMNHLSTNRGLIKYEPGRNIFLKIRLTF
jgi:iron complex outermembrane receptor protein